MAKVIWTEPALSDLDAIADCIALDDHPQSGAKPPELRGWRYRQISEPPCRIFYRVEGERVYILYVMRSEQLLNLDQLTRRDRHE